MVSGETRVIAMMQWLGPVTAWRRRIMVGLGEMMGPIGTRGDRGDDVGAVSNRGAHTRPQQMCASTSVCVRERGAERLGEGIQDAEQGGRERRGSLATLPSAVCTQPKPLR
eukprot:5151198-Pleurochrysis_carterae.AAC.2